MATLAEIQAELRKIDEKNKAREEARNGTGKGRRSGGGDNAQFPFYDTDNGQVSTFRYLPDGNPDNLFPWVERQTIELPFDGTVGGEVDTTDRVVIKVPCPHMFHAIVPGYKVACKITAHIRPWWKPKDGEMYKMAQQYYRKQSWLMQGFVVSAPFVEENIPENPIRRVTLKKQVFNKVFKAYNGTEFEYAPHDFDAGTDFNFEPKPQGEYKNWENSDFARRTRSLSTEERAAVETYSLFVLKDFVGKAPTEEAAEAQYQMFLDSFAGKPYDFGKFGSFYRPYGVRGPKGEEGEANGANNSGEDTQGSTQSEARPAPQTETPASVSSVAEDPNDLIARIRRNALASKA